MKIEISKLLVLQNSLRNVKQVHKMAEFVKQGGKFTYDARLAQHLLTDQTKGTPPPMHISFMEDDVLVLHDGHHRAVGMLLGGREYIEPEEYEFSNYTYKDYSLSNPSNGWFTPFDIKTEVRLANFYHFKNNAKYIYENHPSMIDVFIRQNKVAYCELRIISTIQQLSEVYKCHTMKTSANCVVTN